MRDTERRRAVWEAVDAAKAEIAQLKARVQSQSLNDILDLAGGNLKFVLGVLGNSNEVFAHPGAEEQELKVFGAAELALRTSSIQIGRVSEALEKYGPNATAY
jgi:hypothetical protein